MAVETGWVLIGEIGPRHEAERDGIIGQAPNIAARLQHLARRNGVVIGEGTFPLLRDNFVIEPADTSNLNLPAPIRAAHVIGPVDKEHPLGRLRAMARTLLADRETEMQALLDAWIAAIAGNGRVVLLSGEAGIGKSRAADWADRNARARSAYDAGAVLCRADGGQPISPPHRTDLRCPWYRFQRDGQGNTRSYGGICSRIGTAAGSSRCRVGRSARYPLPPDAPSATEIRRWTFDALLTWFDTLTAKGPMLVLIEDIHWADASLLEFLRRLGSRIGQRRLLLIATHRPEFKVDWQDWPHLETISLGALPIHACHAIATSVAHELDEEIRAAIVERSDGVPLFVEEFARALADQTTSDGRLPGSISQLMLSRLDSLGPARPVAQIAAVFGNEVSTDLLAELSDLDPAESRYARHASCGQRCDGTTTCRGRRSSGVPARSDGGGGVPGFADRKSTCRPSQDRSIGWKRCPGRRSRWSPRYRGATRNLPAIRRLPRHSSAVPRSRRWLPVHSSKPNGTRAAPFDLPRE